MKKTILLGQLGYGLRCQIRKLALSIAKLTPQLVCRCRVGKLTRRLRPHKSCALGIGDKPLMSVLGRAEDTVPLRLLYSKRILLASLAASNSATARATICDSASVSEVV